MARLPGGVRGVVGPPVRRVRRELQWLRPEFRLAVGPATAFPHDVAQHATPLIRELAGLDPQLQHNKVVNLRLAAARLDGLVLRPGQRLSFWREVGAPTRRRGFVDGLVLRQGELGAGVGGGMCQFTNLLFWLTLHTPLTVVERRRHSYDVFPDAGRAQPFGSGATCAWPGLDLQVVNRTGVAFRLGARVGDIDLEGAWTAEAPVVVRYEVYEVDHRITEDAPGVCTRRNVLRRRAVDGAGVVVGDELVVTNEARVMYPLEGR